MLILVWFERSLHPAQVSAQSCPWPLKLMTTQVVDGTWIRIGGYWQLGLLLMGAVLPKMVLLINLQ